VARTIAWELTEPAYALEGNIRSSGATIAWLARLLGSTPAEIAGNAAPDNGGVVLVPAFNGLGAPWWDDRTRAIITGLSDGTTIHHIARAALESIAFQVEDVISAVEQGGSPITVINADGGASSNPELMQLQADTSGRQVVASQTSELSALGAAHIAGLGAGWWTIEDLDRLPRGGVSYRPRGDPSRRLSNIRDWHLAVDAARAIPRSSPEPQSASEDVPAAAPIPTVVKEPR
jgi:glycerol kinase